MKPMILDMQDLSKRSLTKEEENHIKWQHSYCNKFLPLGYEITRINQREGEPYPNSFFIKEKGSNDNISIGSLVETEYGIKKEIHREMINSGLGDVQSKFKYSFDTYETKEQYQVNAKTIALAYVENYNHKDWFMIQGISGSGKSHLSTSIVYALASKGVRARYVSWVKFKNTLLDEMKYNTSNERILDIENQKVLYIDDFLKTGSLKEKPTRYELDVAHRIIENRNLKGLVTIISTEWDIKSLLSFNEAMAGRIMQNVNGYYYDFGRDVKRNYRISNQKSNKEIIESYLKKKDELNGDYE